MAWIIRGKPIARESTVISACLKAGARTAEFKGKEPQALVLMWGGEEVTYPAKVVDGDIVFPAMLDNDLKNVMTPQRLGP